MTAVQQSVRGDSHFATRTLFITTSYVHSACEAVAENLGSLTRVRALSVVASFFLTALTAAVQADDDVAAPGELKQLSLEELMDIQVTSVARHPETLQHAAASIQVITREEIRRSGASSIPEALRLADNLEVAQKNSHDWGISARGFNTALANKLLVMIDGRTVYTPLFSGVFWDVQDYLLEDIERIEVISGPGGTLWGANAVNGVINIITRSAADSQGLYAEGGGGTQLQEFGGARYGGTLAPDISFRVYGKYFDRDDEVFPDGTRAGDNWHQEQGGFRIDTDATQQNTFSLHGDFYEGSEGVDIGGVQQTAGGNLVFRWTDTLSDRSDLSLQSYYDRTHLLDPQSAAILNGLELAPAGIVHDDLTTYDIDFQHRFSLGERNRIVWGLGYRFTHDVVENAPSVAFLPTVLDQNLFSTFFQDEVLFATDWSLILGSKLEHNDYTGFEVEPNVRLQWAVAPNETLWSAISRAARTPSRIDRDLFEPAPPQITVLEGSPKFGSEYVTAYELGYRGQVSSRLSGSVTTFYNDYRDVRSVGITPATIIPLVIENNLEGDTYGLELSASGQLLDFWSLHAGYNFLHESLHVKPGQFDLNDALNETADPKHQASLRSAMNLPLHLDLDATVRWVDTLRTNNGPVVGEVPAYFELDTRIGWHLSRRLEVALVGQNLLHDHHPEYGFPGPMRVQIERSVYGKVAWQY
jgi:iron complex outermembrane recepter protein